MPKRKSDVFCPVQNLSLSSFDAALDILACETFTRLDHLSAKFEAAAGIKLNDGVVRQRWEDAVQRYFMMKGLDGLTCAAAAAGTTAARDSTREAECSRRKDCTDMETEDGTDNDARPKRPLPAATYPGIDVKLRLTPEEVAEWKRWTPKVGDVVLIDLPDDAGLWPGKVIDKKSFFQGRTVPRGNHFFPVRVYSENIEPAVTIKSRLLPLSLRPEPPLLATEAQLGAYNHATNPSEFDKAAASRESAAAHLRTHPGVSDESDMVRIKEEKEAWNKVVNWVMNERRMEKLKALEAERHKRLFQVASADFAFEAVGERCSDSETDGKKRRTKLKPMWDGEELGEVRRASASSIFGPAAIKNESPSLRPSSPSRPIPGLFRPALSIPSRPMSPRKLADKKRVVLIGCGEMSPRRGGTYTPPRILPSGDETAPERTSSPVPSRNFDFVSPLGPVRLGLLSNGHTIGAPETPRRGGLDPVKEEVEDDGLGWTLVGRKAVTTSGDGEATMED